VRLPDPRRSYAVLVGTAVYRSDGLTDLPAVRNNLSDLAAILTDPVVGGFPADRCTVIADPAEDRPLFRELRRLARAAEDTFLVYFAGHGHTGPLNQLYLGLTDTDTDELRVSALDYDLIREILAECPAHNRVVILDCCFSGRAVRHMAGDQETLYGQVAVEGTYVLASCRRNEIAVAPEGATHTAFTGELLRLLRAGVPGGPELLTFGEIYRRLLHTATVRGLPRPSRQGTGTVDQLALTRNPAVPGPARPGPAAVPRPGTAPSAGAGHDPARTSGPAGTDPGPASAVPGSPGPAAPAPPIPSPAPAGAARHRPVSAAQSPAPPPAPSPPEAAPAAPAGAGPAPDPGPPAAPDHAPSRAEPSGAPGRTVRATEGTGPDATRTGPEAERLPSASALPPYGPPPRSVRPTRSPAAGEPVDPPAGPGSGPPGSAPATGPEPAAPDRRTRPAEPTPPGPPTARPPHPESGPGPVEPPAAAPRTDPPVPAVPAPPRATGLAAEPAPPAAAPSPGPEASATRPPSARRSGAAAAAAAEGPESGRVPRTAVVDKSADSGRGSPTPARARPGTAPDPAPGAAGTAAAPVTEARPQAAPRPRGRTPDRMRRGRYGIPVRTNLDHFLGFPHPMLPHGRRLLWMAGYLLGPGRSTTAFHEGHWLLAGVGVLALPALLLYGGASLVVPVARLAAGAPLGLTGSGTGPSVGELIRPVLHLLLGLLVWWYTRYTGAKSWWGAWAAATALLGYGLVNAAGVPHALVEDVHTDAAVVAPWLPGVIVTGRVLLIAAVVRAALALHRRRLPGGRRIAEPARKLVRALTAGAAVVGAGCAALYLWSVLSSGTPSVSLLPMAAVTALALALYPVAAFRSRESGPAAGLLTAWLLLVLVTALAYTAQ
jgi:hypothetical protein